MRWIGWIFFGLAALGVALGFAGRLHPAGDSLALLRPVFALLCLIGLVFLRPKWLRISMAVASLSAAATVLPGLAGQRGGDDLRLYAKNLWWANENMAGIAADIQTANVAVVMLQEVSHRNQEILTMLSADFPYQHWCSRSRWMGEAVLSRTPFVAEPQCTPGRGVAAAQIDVAGTPVWIASLHIPWPWPYESAGNEAAAEELLSSLDGPVVVGGDFNMFPWTDRVRRIAQASGTRLTGPSRATLTLWELPLPIDHVLAPGGGKVERRPLLGSDHRGLVADVNLGL